MAGHIIRDRRGKEEPEEAPAEVERLRQELQQAKADYLRVLAGVDNTKKRLQREKEETGKYAAEAMIRQLLPIIDSLDQAVAAVDQRPEADAITQGVHLIYRQLLGVLQKESVARIATIGQPFDPHQHEAVEQVEASDGQAEGMIVEEVQVGYTMHGKVLRPAMVKVAAKAADSTQPTADRKDESGDPKQA